jgi:hypothetical protein
MTEAYHPFVVVLAAELHRGGRSDGSGAEQPEQTLSPAVFNRAVEDARAFAPAEGETIALHLVAFSRALHLAYGGAVAGFIEQLMQIAAVALSDPRRLRDGFAAAGVDVAAVERVLGTGTSHMPVKADPGAPSLLDIRLGRRG